MCSKYTPFSKFWKIYLNFKSEYSPPEYTKNKIKTSSLKELELLQKSFSYPSKIFNDKSTNIKFFEKNQLFPNIFRMQKDRNRG